MVGITDERESQFQWAWTYGYERVARWTKPNKLEKRTGVRNIFDLDMMIFPINFSDRNHWCCGAINFKEKRIEFYDSDTNTDHALHTKSFFKFMRGYLEDEFKAKGKDSKANVTKKLDLRQWSDHAPHSIPQQKNTYDCGIFSILYGHYLAFDLGPFDFGQKHCTDLRAILVQMCLDNK